MPFIARIRSITTGVAGSPFYTNMYFESTPGSDVPQDWITAVVAFWDDLDLYVSSLLDVVVEGDIAVIDTATGQQTTAYSATPGGHSFSDSGEILPLATQGLIRWETSGFSNGRRIRGRTFVPGPTETRSDAGAPNGAYQTALASAASQLVATAPTPLMVWSPTGLTAEPVDGSSAWSKWAVLRSRRD